MRRIDVQGLRFCGPGVCSFFGGAMPLPVAKRPPFFGSLRSRAAWLNVWLFGAQFVLVYLFECCTF